MTGVLAVELFAVEAFGEPTRLYVNELAMRPHNSGHWTQDGAVTSQFAQHLRAVLDLPLGATEATAPTTVMVNLIGAVASREPTPWPGPWPRTPRPASTSTASSGERAASLGTSP